MRRAGTMNVIDVDDFRPLSTAFRDVNDDDVDVDVDVDIADMRQNAQTTLKNVATVTVVRTCIFVGISLTTGDG